MRNSPVVLPSTNIFPQQVFALAQKGEVQEKLMGATVGMDRGHVRCRRKLNWGKGGQQNQQLHKATVFVDFDPIKIQRSASTRSFVGRMSVIVDNRATIVKPQALFRRERTACKKAIAGG